MKLKFLKLLSTVVVLGAMVVGGAVQANWEAPTVEPPGGNRPRPLNVSDLVQEKTGPLILSNATNGLIMREQSPLVFGNPLGNVVGFKASTTAPASNIIWTLPVTDGQSGYVLTTNGSKQLIWRNPTDLITQDEDWTYQGTSPNYNSITSRFLTKITNELNSANNAELQIKTGANGHWGIYQDNGTADLRFWNGSNRVTFTDSGLVGIGIDNPAQMLDVIGGIKLSGLLFDGSGSSGSAGQLLSRNASNIQWIDPTWWTNASPSYIYATQNTRIGNTGTVDQATGAGDLYVQNKLEVDGNSYLQNISATGLNLNFPNGVIPFQGPSGLAYDANNLIWNNTSKRLGLGTTSTVDFTLQVAGDVGPNTNNTYNLGSAAKRWANIFANNLNITGGLDLGFTTGSVIFQGATALSQNNSKFFWDNTNNRLGLGTNTPAQVLEIKGNLNFTDSLDDGSRGVIMLGGRRYVSSLGKSLWTSVYTGAEEYSNTFIGTMAGASPIDQDSATDNTAIGFYSLNNNITGGANTAIGSNALFNNDGFRNVAIGASALYNNTVGGNLTAIGTGALYSAGAASEVTAVGYNAGYSNSTGNQNVFFGNEAGYSNSTGNKNVFLGYQSGNSNTTGSENIFIGYRAGLNNDVNTGGNVMIGSGAGTYNYTGAGNVFLGAKAGFNESGSNRLYIEPSNADGNNALVYGQFYSSSTSPMLRFNGKVGIAPRGTSGFTPNRLLHIYSPQNAANNADNAEIDIQSIGGINRHWAIYHERNTESLIFWNNNIAGPEEKNLLTLATVGLNKDIPAVGIGTGTDAPYSHLEVRNKAGVNDHGLTISSYTQSALGSLSGGSYGSNVIVFRSGRYKVESSGDNTYQAYNGASIYGGFKDMADGISQSDYRNARLGIQTLTDAGGLSDTIVAQNVRVGIAGNIMRDKTLTVHGSTWSEDYWSDNGRAIGEKGNSGYVCVAVPTTGPSVTALRLRFEDGLYICSCACGATCCATNCTCDNP